MVKRTKADKLFDALYSGQKLTTKQITSRFKLVNPTAAICKLRQDGAKIVLENGKYQVHAA